MMMVKTILCYCNGRGAPQNLPITVVDRLPLGCHSLTWGSWWLWWWITIGDDSGDLYHDDHDDHDDHEDHEDHDDHDDYDYGDDDYGDNIRKGKTYMQLQLPHHGQSQSCDPPDSIADSHFYHDNVSDVLFSTFSYR